MQVRLTPTSYVVLGLLSQVEEATPYQLKRMVAEGVRHVWSLQHAQLYTEPERLVAGGYLTTRRERGGRRRKRYALTDSGRQALAAWLGEPSRGLIEIRDPAFLQLYFGADPRSLANAQAELHRHRLAEFEEEHRRHRDTLPAGVLLTIEAGIGHEREFVRYWSALAADGPERPA